ncbi:MAG TPA: MBL fold metallo-hydrolase [Armatimonadota bacterium]|nr:MBL fold metallo-hydrolase [Armatimonadota bacterium]
MKITPIGAAGEVTGSCFLVEIRGSKFLVDCGMFQGHRAFEERNWHFPFDPADIDAVILTHAHLDHCGRLPLLHAQGFRGYVYATASTCELAQFILLDSAKIQEEDYERRYRKGRRAGIGTFAALYNEQDVIHLLQYFRSRPYKEPFRLGAEMEVVFHQSGHILGSASVELRHHGTSVLFSGDVGTPHRNVVPDYTPPPACDLVFCESTYGDRLHRSDEESVAELRDAINWAYEAGGNIVIPSFAMERTQDVLFQLRGLRQRGEVPDNPVYVDSPLAINITKVYQRHHEDMDEETRAIFKAHDDPFRFPGLTLCTSMTQSREINEKNRVIIIAGSGMCNGGRVVHHLKHNLWRKDSAVVFIGYQAAGTLGRYILERPPQVKIGSELIAVNARLFTINGFSAHADQQALLDWVTTTDPAHVIVNHGESNASRILADMIAARGRSVEIAKPEVAYDTDHLAVKS